MDLMENVRAKAKANPCRVAFPEAGDVKMLTAIDEVVQGKYCTAVIVGNVDEIKKLCKENNVKLIEWRYDEPISKIMLDKKLENL